MIGHKKQWEFFQNLKDRKTAPHAFLFSGQEKLGKKFLALRASMLLNCKSKEVCGICNSCRQIEKGLSGNIFIADSSSEIKISQVRELIRNLSLKTSDGDFKFAIINNAHLMSSEAQNCLLKTLEEPKEKTIIFLITQYPELLLSTIISRVFRIKFFPAKKEEIKEFFKKKGINESRADYLTKLSSGRPGVAVSFLEEPERENSKEAAILEFEKAVPLPFLFRLQYAKKKAEAERPEEALEDWINYFREKAFSSDSLLELREIKRNIDLVFSAKILAMTTNVNKRLLFENLLINLKL